jgi:branched-chain amino acid transport system ATP-binding protein
MVHPHRVILVKTIFPKIVEINRSLGITILLVEQNANLALEDR